MFKRLSASALICCAWLAAGKAHAQIPDGLELGVIGVDPIRLHRSSDELAGIVIDGHLDEPIWRTLQPIGEMRVTEPDTLAKVPYDTNLRVFYTENGIYVSFDMEQPPDTIIERIAPRDAFDVNRDHVGFTLDTSGDGRYGYWMNLSLGDSEMDGTILPERNYSRDWDGAWYGATQRTENGWVAEFYVPWSQMAMPKAEGTRRIGIYVSRRVAHLDERWGWPGLTRTRPRFMSAMQPLELEEVDPRQQWSIFPYASGTLDRVIDESRFKAGADLFWRPSTNFQLTRDAEPRLRFRGIRQRRRQPDRGRDLLSREAPLFSRGPGDLRYFRERRQFRPAAVDHSGIPAASAAGPATSTCRTASRSLTVTN